MILVGQHFFQIRILVAYSGGWSCWTGRVLTPLTPYILLIVLVSGCLGNWGLRPRMGSVFPAGSQACIPEHGTTQQRVVELLLGNICFSLTGWSLICAANDPFRSCFRVGNFSFGGCDGSHTFTDKFISLSHNLVSNGNPNRMAHIA